VSKVKDLHRQAMEQADLAHETRREGHLELAHKHFDQAFRLEREAAELLANRPDAEPSRSILFRSAASLAVQSGAIMEAEKLVCMALAGSPPNDIADELRDLYEQINFKRHLVVRGITLSDEEIQMSLWGRGIGLGIAPTDAVLERVQNAQRLLYRFAERKMQRPYRDVGQPAKEVKQAVSLYMTAPRAASFAVSFIVGGSQPSLPGMGLADSVIGEIIECLEHFAKNEEESLREKIPDQAYYTNFVGLAKAIAPDGEEVENVGFTASRRGVTKTVALKPVSRPVRSGKITEVPGPKPRDEEDQVIIIGTLKYADSLEHKDDRIRIVDDNGAKSTVVVPQGMMSDIVKPLWGSVVKITGIRKGRLIHLTDLARAQNR